MLGNTLRSSMSDVPPNLRCWEWLEPELWLSRFAKRLREKQPQVDESMALDTAKLLRPMLRLEVPENAVTIFLTVMHDCRASSER